MICVPKPISLLGNRRDGLATLFDLNSSITVDILGGALEEND